MWALLFAGSAVCAECHASIAARQRVSHHAQALRPVTATDLAARFSEHPLRERGGAEFLYEPAPGGVKAVVQLGPARAEMLLEWAFGAGAQGVTPVGRHEGRWVEHRISYFTGPRRPSRTVGHPGAPSAEAGAALGLVQDAATIARCFGCHAARVRPGPDLSQMEPGVTCERCHGPGQAHVEAARAKRGAGELARTVLNGGRFTAKASVEICAECHRLAPADTVRSAMPEVEDPVSVRFQPIGLMASRCFQRSAKLACVNCHDPHENAAPREGGYYTAKCLECHASGGRPARRCRRAARENCVACHMEQTSPLMYLKFTDHRIRVR